MTVSQRFPAFPTASGAFPADSGTVSREGPESGNRFPPTVSPFPAVSDRFPPRFPASGTEPVAPFPALSISGKRETVRLNTWLNDLKRRNLTIDITTTGPHLTGRTDLITPTDWHQLTRHRHALELAAQGHHPTWWNHAIGNGPTPHLHDLPTVTDPDDRHGGWGFPCTTCGQPSPYLDHTLLPWCETHA